MYLIHVFMILSILQHLLLDEQDNIALVQQNLLKKLASTLRMNTN